MIVAATDIKITTTFAVIDPSSGAILEKQPFTVDVQNLDLELFKSAHEQLAKIRNDMSNSVSNRMPASRETPRTWKQIGSQG